GGGRGEGAADRLLRGDPEAAAGRLGRGVAAVQGRAGKRVRGADTDRARRRAPVEPVEVPRLLRGVAAPQRLRVAELPVAAGLRGRDPPRAARGGDAGRREKREEVTERLNPWFITIFLF